MSRCRATYPIRVAPVDGRGAWRTFARYAAALIAVAGDADNESPSGYRAQYYRMKGGDRTTELTGLMRGRGTAFALDGLRTESDYNRLHLIDAERVARASLVPFAREVSETASGTMQACLSAAA